jgi:hypothetical protein
MVVLAAQTARPTPGIENPRAGFLAQAGQPPGTVGARRTTWRGGVQQLPSAFARGHRGIVARVAGVFEQAHHEDAPTGPRPTPGLATEAPNREAGFPAAVPPGGATG